MAIVSNGRISKIEELIIKHDERMNAHEMRMDEMQQDHREEMRFLNQALENTEQLLVLEGDRIDRLELIEARQNELFGEISEQLRNLNKS
jgi:hypothetical protein